MLPFPIDLLTKFTATDTILFFLASFSIETHLWLLQHPDYVVFDEVHFGDFPKWYTQSHYFFDVHPSLGKFVMFLLATFSQYSGNIDFEKRYGQVHLTPEYVVLRITPTVFASFCSPLIYLAMRFSMFSHSPSFLTGF
jgi:dolichyl-phosphate-mannose-protein mannosyltransferase